MIRARLTFLMLLIVLPFGAIATQLARLQLVPENHEYYSGKAEHRRTRYETPRRGRIVSRDGEVLATNETLFHLQFRYFELNPRARAIDAILGVLRRHGFSFERDDLEEACRGLASAQSIAYRAERGASQDWLVLMDSLNRDTAQSLRRALRRHEELFELRPGATEGFFDLYACPSRVLQMEIVLERLASLLRRGEAAITPASLRAEVNKVLADVETRARREARPLARSGADAATVSRKYADARRSHLRNPWLLVKDTPAEVTTRIEYHPRRFPGIEVVAATRRFYPLREACGAITGYTRQLYEKDIERYTTEGKLVSTLGDLTTTEFAQVRKEAVRGTDRIGATGLERYYDHLLRGALGMRSVRVDPRNRARATLDALEPQDGLDVVTTLDARLQVRLYEQLAKEIRPAGGPEAGTAGSAVVMDLTSGALLASVSFPGFDPNRIFEKDYAYPEKDSKLEQRWGAQTDGWFLDRPSLLSLFPGSVFKIVGAVAALESAHAWEGDYTAQRRYPCNHTFAFNEKLRCSARYGHTPAGTVNLEEALQYSCNSYFYYLGYKHLEAETLDYWAGALGLGKPTGLDLHRGGHKYEKGYLASPETVPAMARCHYSIGQVHVRVTPLQVVRVVAAVATGRLLSPHLVRPTGHAVAPPLELKPDTLPEIRQGLWRVAHSPEGTAAHAELGLRNFRVALKTGTAETPSKDGGENTAWLVGYAPASASAVDIDPDGSGAPPSRSPRIAFAVVIEETDLHGGEACAPLVRAILEHFADDDPKAYRLEEVAALGGSR